MFCIKNSEGLFFNGFAYIGNGKIKEQWNHYSMVLFITEEEARKSTDTWRESCIFEILPINVEKPEEKKEEIKDKRYLYKTAYYPAKNQYVGIDHAFERNGSFYFVCVYSVYGEPVVLEEEQLISFG